MKVHTMWLVGPIVLAVFILIGAVFALNYFEVEQAVTGYEYKGKLFDEEAIGTIKRITISGFVRKGIHL